MIKTFHDINSSIDEGRLLIGLLTVLTCDMDCDKSFQELIDLANEKIKDISWNLNL